MTPARRPVAHNPPAPLRRALSVRGPPPAVSSLDACLFADDGLAERMSELLCASWSDKATLLVSCGIFVGKLLKLVKASGGTSAALIKFVKKCPNLGAKHEFVVRQLRSYAEALPGGKAGAAELAALGPVLAAQARKAASLIEMLHALGCVEVRDAPTQQLLFKLVAEEETAERRVLALRS